MRDIKLYFKSTDPKLYTLIDDATWCEKRSNRDAFAGLCRIITGQQLSTKAARSIFEKFKNLFPRRRPTPSRLLELSLLELRDVGFSKNKTSSLRDLAEKIVDDTLPLKRLKSLPDDEVVTILTSVRGIGQWSAEMFLIFDLGREDIFSSGDLGLRTAMMKLDRKQRLPTPEEAAIRAKRWSPYRSYACSVLWDSLDNNPK